MVVLTTTSHSSSERKDKKAGITELEQTYCFEKESKCKMKKQKIISAGHVCLDITPEFNERKQKAIHELFLPGQLISMGKQM